MPVILVHRRGRQEEDLEFQRDLSELLRDPYVHR